MSKKSRLNALLPFYSYHAQRWHTIHDTLDNYKCNVILVLHSWVLRLYWWFPIFDTICPQFFPVQETRSISSFWHSDTSTICKMQNDINNTAILEFFNIVSMSNKKHINRYYFYLLLLTKSLHDITQVRNN